jgi:hypothetical protein
MVPITVLASGAARSTLPNPVSMFLATRTGDPVSSVLDVDFTFVDMTDEDGRKINEWRWSDVYPHEPGLTGSNSDPRFD